MRCVLLIVSLLYAFASSGQVNDFETIDFRKADSVAKAFAGYSLQNPDKLAQKLVQDMTTDVEKFRVIFMWIAGNISYDYPLYVKMIKREKKLRHKRKRLNAFSTRASKSIFRGMILQKKTVCSGYATLLEYMCQKVGLPCVFISGYGRDFGTQKSWGPNHAWNAVKLSNDWYLCDVTWASGSVDEMGRFHKFFNESYFLTEPTLFLCNHYPSDKSWTLVKDAPSLTQFLKSTFKANGFIENWINQYSPDKEIVKTKTSIPFELRFTSNASHMDSTASIHIISTRKKGYNEKFRVVLSQEKTGEYLLAYTFEKRGDYFVYISVNGTLTWVYRVVAM